MGLAVQQTLGIGISLAYKGEGAGGEVSDDQMIHVLKWRAARSAVAKVRGLYGVEGYGGGPRGDGSDLEEQTREVANLLLDAVTKCSGLGLKQPEGGIMRAFGRDSGDFEQVRVSDLRAERRAEQLVNVNRVDPASLVNSIGPNPVDPRRTLDRLRELQDAQQQQQPQGPKSEQDDFYDRWVDQRFGGDYNPDESPPLYPPPPDDTIVL